MGVASNSKKWFDGVLDLLKVSNAEKMTAKSKAAYKFNAKKGKVLNETLKDSEKIKNVHKNISNESKGSIKEALKDTKAMKNEHFDEGAIKNIYKGSFKQAAADGVDVTNEKAMQNYFNKNNDDIMNSINTSAKWEQAKGYFTEPLKAMGNKNITEAERKVAQKQFVARAGTATGAVALGAGLTHDLVSTNENDTGIGGITVNTAAAGGLATAAAAGVSMLAKL